MNTRVKRTIQSLLGWAGFGHKYSYSQYGEDIIIRELLYTIGVIHPFYLDIGANQPRWLSNTYLFYSRGARGICVDADPTLEKPFIKVRPHDTFINAGISSKDDETLNFYLLSDAAVNTFSREEAEKYVSFGAQKIEKVIPIRCITLSTLIARHVHQPIDFLNLDVEGMDDIIIRSLDMIVHRPKVICLETMLFDENEVPIKQQDIIQYLQSQNYMVYADTFLNTIFVDASLWQARFARKVSD